MEIGSRFFRDNEILLQINKDCQRLCPDFDFFRRPTEYSCLSLFGKEVPVGVLRRRGETSALQSRSLNKNLAGVTDMIHLPTYAPFQPSHRLSSGLVTQSQELDGSHEAGLGGQMKILSDLLSKFDNNLSKHFKKIELVPEHFAFRWLSLLLAREFMLPDVLLLWDTLFSDPHRFNLLPYVCCSMLIGIRDQLLKADFPTAVQLVQNYPSNVDVMHILLKARTFYTDHRI
ncbi:unnamed protein product [Schistosoma mattheei]|uniref:Rab-GAP TBC domain-containing protein n=1 Tax=Schistosoma mattheei TaxID=31246 RepID=A0AA85B811_9TREM|nr:unnamed protein product [Schistosoma mattheei]